MEVSADCVDKLSKASFQFITVLHLLSGKWDFDTFSPAIRICMKNNFDSRCTRTGQLIKLNIWNYALSPSFIWLVSFTFNDSALMLFRPKLWYIMVCVKDLVSMDAGLDLSSHAAQWTYHEMDNHARTAMFRVVHMSILAAHWNCRTHQSCLSFKSQGFSIKVRFVLLQSDSQMI